MQRARHPARPQGSDELYILPHPESREFVQRRFARIDRSYDSLPGVPPDG